MSSIDRRAVGEALNRLAFAAEFLDDEAVDAKACGALAWSVRSLEGEVTVERIAGMDGVSVPILAVIDDVAHARTPPLLSSLERRLPAGLLEVRRLKGLGPKKIRALWKDLDVTSLGELEYACRENRLIELKGFGEKTQESVLQQIDHLRAQTGLLRLDQAAALADVAMAALAAHGGRTEVVGELKRCCELVERVALLTTVPAALVLSTLKTLAGDAPEATVTLDGDRVHARVDDATLVVRVGLSPERFGWASLCETGPAPHIEELKRVAERCSVDLDALDAPGEDAVYDALGLWPVPPERREAAAVLVEKARPRPALVTLADLRGSLHNHTTASDGTASLEEMRAAAHARGYAYLAITDHSQSAVYARGLAAATLERQRADIRALNGDGSAASACVLLSGVESDILRDGALDYPPAALAPLDVVIASVHARFGQKGDDLTRRMVTAATHPHTDVVGHPTGRLLLGRAAAEYDVMALLDACVRAGCAVELNANPARLDLNEHHLAAARERGIPISIAADAHSTHALDHLAWGVAIARRAGLRPDDVLNARDLVGVRAWIAARREKAHG